MRCLLTKHLSRFVHIVSAMFLLFVSILYAEDPSPVLFDYGNAETLQFEMKLSKTAIVAYEPLFVTLKVKNLADHTLQFMGPLDSPARFQVIDPSGQTVPLNHLFADVMWVFGSQSLKPDELLTANIELSKYLNIGEKIGDHSIRFTYQLLRDVPIYQNGKESIGTEEAGQIVIPAKFRIILPQSFEDRAALELLALAIKKQREGYYPGDDILKNYQLVINKYPTSQYAEWATFQIAYYYDIHLGKDPNNLDRAIQSYRNFVQKYPKSLYFETAQRAIKSLEEMALVKELNQLDK